MFKAPFSFSGRIRRTEYGISMIIILFTSLILNLILGVVTLEKFKNFYNSNSANIVILVATLIGLVIRIPIFCSLFAKVKILKVIIEKFCFVRAICQSPLQCE